MNRVGMVPRRERSPVASRYELLVKIATGATATVYLARRVAGGPHSFSRLVAVKRPHPHLVDDAAARRALREEAAVASHVHHANVAAVQDFEESEDDLLLIMDYVEGGSLAELLEAAPGKALKPSVAVRIGLDVAEGLAAVHETRDEAGQPLALLHRDVSPQNVLVGVDGTARLTDFGLAKLAPSEHSRTTGQVQGKIAYVSPEYVDGGPFTVQSEVFALGVVLWEALANRRLFRGTNEADTLRRILTHNAPLLSQVASHVGPHLDAVIAKALEKSPARRYATVRELAVALERAARAHDMVATSAEVGACVRERVGDALERRRAVLRASLAVADLERQSAGTFGETVSMVHGDVDDVANESTAAMGIGDVSDVVAPISNEAAVFDRPSQPVSLRPVVASPDVLDVEEEMLTKPLPKVPPSAPSSPESSSPAIDIPSDSMHEVTGPIEPQALAALAPEAVAQEPLTARALAAIGAVAPPRLGTLVGIAIVAFVSTVLIMVWTRSPRDEGAPTLSFEAPSEPAAASSVLPPPARTATLSIDDLPGTPVELDPQALPDRGTPARAGRPQPPPQPRPRPVATPEKRTGASPPRDNPSDEPVGTGSATPPPNPYKNKP